MDILSETLKGLLSSDDIALVDEKQRAFYTIFTYIRPVDFYLTLLYNGNVYDKSFACRMLSLFFADSEISKIRKYVTSKNRDLTYNAALTLSSLGDEEGVMNAIIKFESNHELSHRVIVELLEGYSGDMNQLARKLLNNNNEYIKASVVKALAKYRIEGLAPAYGRYLIDGGKNLKIAAIKALGELGDTRFEHELIVASRSTEWEIRAAAVKALRNTVTVNTLEAVARSTKDSQWWVRYNAANSLVIMDRSRIYVNRILHDYDKYAIEVVRNALYHDTSKVKQLRGVV
jgi:HEAT repeat protein